MTQARDRLEKALARLERAAQGGRGGANVADLSAQLDDLRARNLMLDQRNRAVAERLDTAIAKLRTLVQD